PEICKRLLKLAKENRLKIILDNAGDHDDPSSWEKAFEQEFKNVSDEPEFIQRGNFSGLNHSKVFILLKNNKAFKVLSGSTNFSTNGLYINSNHAIIFTSNGVAQLYSDVFDASFGEENMSSFKGSDFSTTDFIFDQASLPGISISFAPHPKADAERIFDRISNRINGAETDLLFAIMKDTSTSSILDAVQNKVKTSDVFTYGITDVISKNNTDYTVFLYKPNSKRGLRVAARGITNVLPKPFGKVAAIDGYAIHHKFVVVDFKGKNPVVYCGSSNLAFGPEQKNGDNLLEIHDRDVVTAFAIEALRLVDHFHWRNRELTQDELNLDDLNNPATAWYNAWFIPGDLRSLQRELYISAAQS
ncbi:MAG TPA: phospholipase D-like domain-containing protein, partial [Chitinophagaceae bacterium]|nr:phospholipase D-like domain-containing protein [Chitinophagaceae bacterium]